MKESQGRSEVDRLLQRALRKDRRAMSQLMSLAENDPRSRIEILSRLYWRRKGAHVVGVTGPPGCGKSTLIARLAKRYRESGYTVGIVAVDPSSQITGGALLGDRIRMGDLAADPQIFIRSMATRGHFGGLARATEDAVRILATSMDRLIVETAGAGQSDVDVKTLADTVVVVTAPGLGDEIQALKAGLMEIGDIFVVNKAEKEEADQTAREIFYMISLSNPSGSWRQPVLKTVATTGEGVDALIEATQQHWKHVQSVTPAINVEKTRATILDAAREYFDDVKLKKMENSRKFKRMIAGVQSQQIDPYTAARALVDGKATKRFPAV